MAYPAFIPLMRTPRLPAFDVTDAPRRFKWTRPFRRKTKSGFCACAITFQTQSTTWTAQINRLENINVSWQICSVIVAIIAIVPCTLKAIFFLLSREQADMFRWSTVSPASLVLLLISRKRRCIYRECVVDVEIKYLLYLCRKWGHIWSAVRIWYSAKYLRSLKLFRFYLSLKLQILLFG